jgi:DNA-binding HxlR family transcriptional regulator
MPGVSVSDVMKILPGVSDKTIQRELVAMVEAGVLEKKGEKRWSVYSLQIQ